MIALISTLLLISLWMGISMPNTEAFLQHIKINSYQKKAFCFLNTARAATASDQVTRHCYIHNNQLCCQDSPDNAKCLSTPQRLFIKLNRDLSFKATGKGQSGTLFIQLGKIAKEISVDAITGYLRAKP